MLSKTACVKLTIVHFSLIFFLAAVSGGFAAQKESQKVDAALFDRLVKEWEEYISKGPWLSSSAGYYVSNKYYDRIIDLGPPALPFIMERYNLLIIRDKALGVLSDRFPGSTSSLENANDARKRIWSLNGGIRGELILEAILRSAIQHGNKLVAARRAPGLMLLAQTEIH